MSCSSDTLPPHLQHRRSRFNGRKKPRTASDPSTTKTARDRSHSRERSPTRDRSPARDRRTAHARSTTVDCHLENDTSKTTVEYPAENNLESSPSVYYQDPTRLPDKLYRMGIFTPAEPPRAEPSSAASSRRRGFFRKLTGQGMKKNAEKRKRSGSTSAETGPEAIHCDDPQLLPSQHNAPRMPHLPPAPHPIAQPSRLQFPSTAPPQKEHRKPFLENIRTQVSAEIAFDNCDIPLALELYGKLAKTPQILFNMGQLHMFCLDYDGAFAYYFKATNLDEYFLCGWLQMGAIDFIEGRYLQACRAFAMAMKALRKYEFVDYEQLGMAFRIDRESVHWNLRMAKKAEDGGSKYARGVRPNMVPTGALFRIPGWQAKARFKQAGEDTDWMFQGPGREVGRRESIYPVPRDII